MEKTFYLKDKQGFVIGKFVQDDIDYGFMGKAFTCISWHGENNEPYDFLFHSDAVVKWDGETHWYFEGEKITADPESYYCLGGYYFQHFIAMMAFVKLLGFRYWTEYFRVRGDEILSLEVEEGFDTDYLDYILKDYGIEEVTDAGKSEDQA